MPLCNIIFFLRLWRKYKTHLAVHGKGHLLGEQSWTFQTPQGTSEEITPSLLVLWSACLDHQLHQTSPKNNHWHSLYQLFMEVQTKQLKMLQFPIEICKFAFGEYLWNSEEFRWYKSYFCSLGLFYILRTELQRALRRLERLLSYVHAWALSRLERVFSRART